MRIFPHNYDFFKLFARQADELISAVKVIRKLERNADIETVDQCARRVKKIEHNADEITHEIIKTLNKTFITPIDREDITVLVSHMDNVVDEMERAINRISIYKISPVPPAVWQYIRIADESISEIAKGINEMSNSRHRQEVLQYAENINRLENKTDDLHRHTLTQLFLTEKDPITIIKLREIYEALENVTDRCEDVANSLETIVVKNL